MKSLSRSKLEICLTLVKEIRKMAHPVKLYIYDLSGGLAKRFAPMFGIDFDIEGIWHTSVVVHGMEVFFGSDGIQFSQPGGTSLGCPLLQHDMVK